MKTLTTKNGLAIEFNGRNTYFLSEENGDCIGYFNTERKALNAMNKTLKLRGLI